MTEPTRAQDDAAKALAGTYDSVRVVPPARAGAEVAVHCFRRHEQLPGRDAHVHNGLHCVASFTFDADGKDC